MCVYYVYICEYIEIYVILTRVIGRLGGFNDLQCYILLIGGI